MTRPIFYIQYFIFVPQKDVILVLQSPYDPNDAYDDGDEALFMLFREIKDYDLVHNKVSNIGDIYDSLEDLGILKMDFLGLRNLTVIDKTIKMVEKNHSKIIEIEKIPLDDTKVYKMFSDAKTTGIFQFESDGMREHLKNLKPTSIKDLIAMNALYRPGPMANIPKLTYSTFIVIHFQIIEKLFLLFPFLKKQSSI